MNADDIAIADPDWARDLIQDVIALLVRGRSYPKPLPPELEPWYCYTQDGGHSIAVVVKNRHKPGDPVNELVPAPVKAVLRSKWTLTDQGVVVCDLPYDEVLGLVTAPEDDEF